VSLAPLLRQRSALRDGLVVGAWLAAAYHLWYVWIGIGPRYANGALGIDAFAYFDAWNHDLYDPVGPNGRRYLYSPAFAQVVWPLTHLDWQVFSVLWFLLGLAAFTWLLWPLPWVWRVPLLVLLCADELIIGNVRWIVALALVATVRRPAFWAIPVLLKPLLGIGCLYYVARRDWKALAQAAGATAAVVAVSAAVVPDLWLAWVRYLTFGDVGFQLGLPFFVARVIAAAALVWWGARTDRYWVVAPALALASPVFTPPAEPALLAAIPRLLAASRPAPIPVTPDDPGSPEAVPPPRPTRTAAPARVPEAPSPAPDRGRAAGGSPARPPRAAGAGRPRSR
jgi:hypothetical protein